jgi:uncharacterized protein (DUF4415 family)
MKNKNLPNTSRTNWDAVNSMPDEEIDYSDIPPLTDAFFERATVRIPDQHTHPFIPIDPEILQWFQDQTQDYHSLINAVLRHHIENNTQT